MARDGGVANGGADALVIVITALNSATCRVFYTDYNGACVRICAVQASPADIPQPRQHLGANSEPLEHNRHCTRFWQLCCVNFAVTLDLPLDECCYRSRGGRGRAARAGALRRDIRDMRRTG